MKIFIFSDSHGNIENMTNVLQNFRGEYDYIIHLGDHCTDVHCINNIIGVTPLIAVTGNTDFVTSEFYPDEKIIEIAGHRLYICHGHRHGVKTGLEILFASAKAHDCDVALFGHTHQKYSEILKGVTLFNPGSIGVPNSSGYSFGILTIDKRILSFEFVEVKI